MLMANIHQLNPKHKFIIIKYHSFFENVHIIFNAWGCFKSEVRLQPSETDMKIFLNLYKYHEKIQQVIISVQIFYQHSRC